MSFVTPGELKELEKISERLGASLSATIHNLLVRSLEEGRLNRPRSVDSNEQGGER